MNASTSVGRGRRRARLTALALGATALASGLCVPAQADNLAQQQTKATPESSSAPATTSAVDGGSSGGQAVPLAPERATISPGGVDMRTGRFVSEATDLSIGAGDGLLELARGLATGPDAWGQHRDRFGSQFGHNWDIFLTEHRVKVATANTPSQYDYHMTVHMGGLGTTFWSSYYQPQFQQESNDGAAELTYTGTPSYDATYTYSAADGTKVLFRPINSYDCTTYYKCAYASQITKADGTQYTLEYDNSAGITNPGQTRLRSVTSNRGYALLLEYNAPAGDYNLIAKACVLNLAQIAKPADNVCPAGVPTATYTYAGAFLTAATDGAGATSTFTKTGSGASYTIAYTHPGDSAPYVTNTVSEDAAGYQSITHQQFADGRSYSYSWHTYDAYGVSTITGGSYVDDANHSVDVQYGWHDGPAIQWTVAGQLPTEQATPGPESVTDELGRVWTANYCLPGSDPCAVGPLVAQTLPEGNSVHYQYDYNRNITETRRIAKPGSGLADLTTTATFYCVSPTCHKPLTVTDARGVTANFSYDPVHGGIVSEMQAAPMAGAARPLKLYSYVQKSAYVTNASGVLVSTGLPVWLLDTETQCQTVAGSSTAVCDAAAPKVVTSFQYGADGTADNLLLRGQVVTAGGSSFRTCYAYDPRGNRIAETSPRAGLTSCP